VAKSKNAKKRQQAQRKKQAQHRQVHNAAKSRERDAHREHLPKTGTAADDEYLLKRSRQDLVDFGLTRVRGGWVNIVIGVVVVLALLGLILFFIVY
jgi:hypothetical protein